MNSNERALRKLPLHILRVSAPAVLLARFHWRALSEGLLEEKPLCPLCIAVDDNCDHCVLHIFDFSIDHNCGFVYCEWSKAIYRTSLCRAPIKSPAAMQAAARVVDVLDEIWHVIEDELGRRRK